VAARLDPPLGFDAPDMATCPTFRDWAERSIDSRARANRRTRADYKRDLRLTTSTPRSGDVPLDRIAASMSAPGWSG
jgi:hypothetical protein